MTTEAAAPTVRFGRLERRGVLLGLTAAQLAVLGSAVAIVTVAEYTLGLRGVLASSPVWGLLVLLGLVRIDSRPLIAWVPLLSAWTVRGFTGAATWRTHPGSRRPDTVLGVPGVPGVRGRIVVQELDDGTAAVVERGTTTVVVEVTGRGFVLADAAGQARMVAGWGRVLAWACQQPDVVRVQVLHRAGPGGASGVRRWWADHGVRDSSWASRLVSGLLADSASSTDRYECFVALAVRRGSAVLDLLGAFTDALVAAELDVAGRVTPSRLERVLRAGYDPAGALILDETGAADRLVGSGVVAMGVREEWDRLRTDSAWHATYWVSEWPRAEVHAGFLQPVLLAPGTHRSFSVIAEPLPLAEAMREIRRAKADHVADSAQRARIGQIEDESVRAEAADVMRREQELVAGHGDLRFVGLLTVSAASSGELDGACAVLEAAAARSMVEVRRLVGQQMLAHASACLPLARRVT